MLITCRIGAKAVIKGDRNSMAYPPGRDPDGSRLIEALDAGLCEGMPGVKTGFGPGLDTLGICMAGLADRWGGLNAAENGQCKQRLRIERKAHHNGPEAYQSAPARPPDTFEMYA